MTDTNAIFAVLTALFCVYVIAANVALPRSGVAHKPWAWAAGSA
jgi:hypothetical protein